MLMESISKRFKDHYESKFAEFGASPLGVDWGKEEELLLRYRKMLSVMRPQADTTASMLDVGCGYGGLFDYALVHGVGVDYTGIDVAANMIEHAKEHHQDGVFHSGDVLHYPFDRRFDYVVCNGILTQKLETKIREMDHFCNALVRRMFDLCDIGLAFNIMSNKVNLWPKIFTIAVLWRCSHSVSTTSPVKSESTTPIHFLNIRFMSTKTRKAHASRNYWVKWGKCRSGTHSRSGSLHTFLLLPIASADWRPSPASSPCLS